MYISSPGFTKFKLIELDTASLGMIGQNEAYSIIKERMLNTEQQELLCVLILHVPPSICISQSVLESQLLTPTPGLLCQLPAGMQSILHWNVMHSIQLYWWWSVLTMFRGLGSERRCSCYKNSVETLEWLFFYYYPLHFTLQKIK